MITDVMMQLHFLGDTFTRTRQKSKAPMNLAVEVI